MTALTWFRVGAWLWIVTGTGHLLGDIYLRATTVTEIDALMRAHSLDLMGTRRTYYQLMMSFSLAMGVALVFVGILLLYLANVVPDIRPVAGMALAMSLVSLTMSVWLDPPPPIVLFSLACVCFGCSLRHRSVRREALR